MSLSKENKVIIDGQTYYGGLNQPPKFVKVNVDCWEKIFDYLPLRDILSMSQTCQRMRQIGGYYFRENFHGTVCELNDDSGPSIRSIELKRDDFLRFVDTAFIHRDLEDLKHYSSLDVLGSLTTLILYDVKLNADAIDNFEKNLMDKIETVQLIDCTIHDDFDGQLFASCPKFKCLRIIEISHTSNTTENCLLRYTYPTLEYFEYFCGRITVSLLKSFLVRNTSIKTLRIDADYLLKIGLNTSTVRLDCLIVAASLNVEAVELSNRLKALHVNGFYKKLHLELGDSSDYEAFINEMKSFSALEVLCTWRFHANICHLTALKELHLIGLPDDGADLELIAKNLTKLERVRIRIGCVDRLIPFLRYSKELEVAVLDDEFEANSLNLFDLNRMRRTGGSQRKVSICVREDQYLATQWKSKNVKYDLVEITRAGTIRERFEYQRW